MNTKTPIFNAVMLLSTQIGDFHDVFCIDPHVFSKDKLKVRFYNCVRFTRLSMGLWRKNLYKKDLNKMAP